NHSGTTAAVPSRERRSQRLRYLIDDDCRHLHEVRADDDIRAQVARQFGEDARKADVPVQRLVVLLKSCVMDSPGRMADSLSHGFGEKVLRWALDGYYGPSLNT
ncbi:MAG: hypothetical protein ABJD07_09975, partial [Gemmatimonadaceae bacterium]